jgi:hypothetical protein
MKEDNMVEVRSMKADKKCMQNFNRKPERISPLGKPRLKYEIIFEGNINIYGENLCFDSGFG